MQLPTEFVYPGLLYLAIPAALVLLWLTRHSFVKDNPRYDDAAGVKRRSKLRWTVFALRTLAIACLIIAIATPLTQQTKTRAGDAHITVLIDNSSSMALLDTEFTAEFIADLRKDLPVTVHTITPGDSSAIGDGVLSYLKPNENILLITDGNSNSGPSLATVATYAQQTNSTISAVKLKPKAHDAAVNIEGPVKAIADTNTTLAVHISRTHEDDDIPVTVTVDDEVIYDDKTQDDRILFTKSFPAGKHRISAQIGAEDALAANNKYDFLLNVVDKPRILVVTQKSSGLQPLLGQLYTVTTQATVPRTAEELKPYYAVVLVDVPASAVGASTEALTQYLLDGNGLLVVGGPHSFDYGGYKNTVFESLLPVTVGSAKNRDGVTNIAVVMDLSGSVEGSYVLENGQLVFKKSDKPALTRALTLSVIEGLDKNHNVGAVVVGSASKNASSNIRGEGELIQWDYVGGKNLGKVSLLGPKRENLTAAVSMVQGGGQAASQYWLYAPMKALETTPGSKNIIIITDGQSCTQNCQAASGGSDEAQTINLARTVAAQGGRVYTVGVVPGKNDDFLIELAQAGNGIYFPASERNKLRILFGDPDEDIGAQAFGLVVLNENHFITRDVPLQATMYGYNEVVPRPYSAMLVTAGTGQPALTTWNYGIGRVATLTTYNGDDYGELLMKGNSLLISRTGNWVVGDPERKEEYVITVPQLHVGTPGTITVQTDKIATNPELQFTPSGPDTFEATYTPQETGFNSVGGIVYAANYPVEYEAVGMNPQLERALSISKGKLFDPGERDAIIEHVQTVRALQESHYQPWRYPFILAAAILFLLEIAIRRVYEVLRSRAA